MSTYAEYRLRIRNVANAVEGNTSLGNVGVTCRQDSLLPTPLLLTVMFLNLGFDRPRPHLGKSPSFDSDNSELIRRQVLLPPLCRPASKNIPRWGYVLQQPGAYRGL